jgi:hypothetical protein
MAKLYLLDCLQRATLPLPSPNTVHRLGATVAPFSPQWRALRHPLRRAPLLSHARWRGSLFSPLPCFSWKTPPVPHPGKFALHFSPSRRVYGSRTRSGDAAADLPAEGRIGAGSGRLRGRQSRVREHTIPFATEDEAATNPLPPRIFATTSFVSFSELRRHPQIRTCPLRFVVLRPKSSGLEVRPCSSIFSQVHACSFHVSNWTCLVP